MNDFIKSILKSNFRYDDDGFFGDDHYSMHEGARYLKKIIRRIIKYNKKQWY